MKAISARIEELNSQLPTCYPTDDEIAAVRSAQRTAASLENKLCGMNLNAVINMLGGNSIEIVSLRTGENADLEIHGRHDPCILPRAVPVVEAMAAIGIMELWKERAACLDGSK